MKYKGLILVKIYLKTMNENVNLCEILKNCPKGTKFYSYIHGPVEFNGIDNSDTDYPILIKTVQDDGTIEEDTLTKGGRYSIVYKDSKCILVPSLEQPDWSKWEYPTKFDPKTLKPFDKVLVPNVDRFWQCCLFSHITDKLPYPINCISSRYEYCIPYNDETKHLVGTTDEAPEYYRYWED